VGEIKGRDLKKRKSAPGNYCLVRESEGALDNLSYGIGERCGAGVCLRKGFGKGNSRGGKTRKETEGKSWGMPKLLGGEGRGEGSRKDGFSCMKTTLRGKKAGKWYMVRWGSTH